MFLHRGVYSTFHPSQSFAVYDNSLVPIKYQMEGLFEYSTLSAPHYFGKVLEWTGVCVACNFSVASLAFGVKLLFPGRALQVARPLIILFVWYWGRSFVANCVHNFPALFLGLAASFLVRICV